jgi:hypothetical protein
VEDGGGIGIAIDPDRDGNLESADRMAPGRRVHDVEGADYRKDSELMKSLYLSLDIMIARIQLLRLGRGD